MLLCVLLILPHSLKFSLNFGLPSFSPRKADAGLRMPLKNLQAKLNFFKG